MRGWVMGTEGVVYRGTETGGHGGWEGGTWVWISSKVGGAMGHGD